MTTVILSAFKANCIALLREFPKRPEIVCQLDNLAVRTLLWPESGIPGNSGIDPACDRQHLEDAVDIGVC